MTFPRTVLKAHGTGNDFVIWFDEHGEYEPTLKKYVLLTTAILGWVEMALSV